MAGRRVWSVLSLLSAAVETDPVYFGIVLDLTV
jgi:hypothetical protein